MSKELILETMESIKEYLPKLIVASETISRDIQTNQGGWLDTMLAYLEGIEWLTTAITGIKQLDQEILAGIDIQDLVPSIGQINQALGTSDYVALCDTLLYELQPLLISYEEEIRRVLH
ncbi:MAG TPA: hypothetical protein VE710_10165 [Candidatus Bathyarchaeia archaeon]|nr:hypothetical protein [Candidatus Bathyarchaeia archaeon]